MGTAGLSHILARNSTIAASATGMLIMISTGMLSAGMTLTMVVAVCPCVHQFPAQVCFHCFISTPGSACTQLNPAFGKSRLGAATNTAAYQDIKPFGLITM